MAERSRERMALTGTVQKPEVFFGQGNPGSCTALLIRCFLEQNVVLAGIKEEPWFCSLTNN